MSAVCIIGMHRSGTSVITGLLRVHGLRIGSEDCLLGPHETNPTGHCEHKGFLEINEVLLARLGGAWDTPVEFPLDWQGNGRFDDLAERAASLVESLSCSRPWGWKEPRTTLLLPFWQALVPDLRYVICIRHPLEVAHSIAARDGFALPRAIDLWLHYTRAALAFTSGRPRMFTFYRDYFTNPLAEIRRLAHFCGLSPPDDTSALSQLLSAKLCHHICGARQLLAHPVIPLSAKLLYYRLRAARCLFGR